MTSALRQLLAILGDKIALACVLLPAIALLSGRLTWPFSRDDKTCIEARQQRSAAPASFSDSRPGWTWSADARVRPLPPVDDPNGRPAYFAAEPGPVAPLKPAELVRYASELIDDPQSDAPLPARGPRHEVLPVGDSDATDKVKLTTKNDLITLTARNAPLSAVLTLIAEQHGLNIIHGQEITQSLTVTLKDVRLTDALDAILSVNQLTWSVQNNILFITSFDGASKPGAAIQGRILKVFPLNFVAAADVDKVVKGLLSPAGQSFILETNSTDHRRTHEQLVVEDLPQYLQRVESYIYGVDYQPRQVIVEAHILQVKLADNMKRGVNLQQLLTVANADITFRTQGLASATASPAGILTIDGTDFDAVIEALQSTTDTKTLASPKVAVLNGQEARIQIGGQIGYLTSTSTMTTTVQTVNFLDTGVILTVVPTITADRQILLTVKPQVSTGRINPATTLPESETTEVETRVMLADGEVVVIGGLISEKDIESENKLPLLGNIKYIGALFRRRTVERERSEVIITLRPRIVSEVPGCREADPRAVIQAGTPLFHGPLTPIDRKAWEATLPSATTEKHALPPPVDVGPSGRPEPRFIDEPVLESLPRPQLTEPSPAFAPPTILPPGPPPLESESSDSGELPRVSRR